MANKSSFSWDRFRQAPVIGILRGISADVVRQIAQTYLEAGFNTLEVTMNTEGAADLIAALGTGFPGLHIGAGTVCTRPDLDEALDAGAQFIVTPIMDEEVIKAAVAQDVPIFPGAYSPTEIYKAWALGATAVKVFPATQLGAQFIRDVSAPLDGIRLLPTGGVSLDNIRSFFEAGAAGVGMGNSLFDKKLIQSGNFEGLRDHFIKIKTEIQEFIKNNPPWLMNNPAVKGGPS